MSYRLRKKSLAREVRRVVREELEGTLVRREIGKE